VIGTLLKIDERLEALGEKIENKLGHGESFAKSFVSSTLLFCVGAMAIVGSLDAGLTGDNSTLFAKSILDGISSIIFASTLGFGVIFSIVPLILYQGGIALLAGVIAPVLSQNTITGMKLVGSLLIVALSLNMLNITKIKVANLVPAVFLPIGLVPLCEFIIKLF
ncbi:MAG: DUF554 domain-containing protein, partial [Clostridiales bacterium]|nr:DUF554 domain-containing protein [Clostridiales bacterium]